MNGPIKVVERRRQPQQPRGTQFQLLIGQLVSRCEGPNDLDVLRQRRRHTFTSFKNSGAFILRLLVHLRRHNTVSFRA